MFDNDDHKYEQFSPGPMPVQGTSLYLSQTRRPTVPVDATPHELQVGKQEGRLLLVKHAKRVIASEILACVLQL